MSVHLILRRATRQSEAYSHQRALNAEDALKTAYAEIDTQRERIGILLGQIRDLQAQYTEGTAQRLAGENTALNQRVRQLTEDNPRYTGRQVWNKQRTDEVLLDVDDVALGHIAVMRWNGRDQWLVSKAVVHEPLVNEADFDRARDGGYRARRLPGGSGR